MRDVVIGELTDLPGGTTLPVCLKAQEKLLLADRTIPHWRTWCTKLMGKAFPNAHEHPQLVWPFLETIPCLKDSR